MRGTRLACGLIVFVLSAFAPAHDNDAPDVKRREAVSPETWCARAHETVARRGREWMEPRPSDAATDRLRVAELMGVIDDLAREGLLASIPPQRSETVLAYYLVGAAGVYASVSCLRLPRALSFSGSPERNLMLEALRESRYEALLNFRTTGDGRLAEGARRVAALARAAGVLPDEKQGTDRAVVALEQAYRRELQAARDGNELSSHQRNLNEQGDQFQWTKSEKEAIGAAIERARSQRGTHTVTLERRREIDAHFRGCLGRPATEADFGTWVPRAEGGAELRDAICELPDARARLVRELYDRCLQRPARDAEVRGWVTKRIPRGAFEKEICEDSPESRQVWVKDLYRRCLDREAAPPEYTGWAAKPLDRNQLGNEICGSAEGRTLSLIKHFYQECLGRPANRPEVLHWLPGFRPYTILREGICNSEEAIKGRIARAYLECLGRPARADEVEVQWNAVRVLPLKAKDRGHQVFHNICYAPEALPLAIARAYQDCLGRNAGPDEIARWVRANNPVRATVRLICLSKESMGRVNESWYDGPRANHVTSGSESYNIWQNNCHSAANSAILANPAHTGAISCQGNPETDPRYHTFVYVRAADNTTTYHNWGQACGPCPGEPPASYAPSGGPSACHLDCAQRFCGDQFTDSTRSLPTGRLLEIPGPSACISQTWRQGGGLDACTTCCDYRADLWTEFEPSYRAAGKGAEHFRRACFHLCRGHYQ